jgi:hypothetical protein
LTYSPYYHSGFFCQQFIPQAVREPEAVFDPFGAVNRTRKAAVYQAKKRLKKRLLQFNGFQSCPAKG